MGLFTVLGGLLSAAISTVGPIISTVANVLINKLPPVIETLV